MYENGKNDNNRNESISPDYEGGVRGVLSLMLIVGTLRAYSELCKDAPSMQTNVPKGTFSSSLEPGPRAWYADRGLISAASWGLVRMGAAQAVQLDTAAL